MYVREKGMNTNGSHKTWNMYNMVEMTIEENDTGQEKPLKV